MQISWITDNGRWKTVLENDRQWGMTDYGKWQTMMNYRQWGMTNKEEMTDRGEMTDNWHWWEMIDNGDDRQ